MKTYKLSLWLLALSFVLITGMKCKKETTVKEPQLPPETQIGAETFGCLVDGKVFVPEGSFTISGLSTVIQFEILSLGASKLKTKKSIALE